MKQLLILMLAVGLATSASAQHHGGGRVHVPVRSHVGVGFGIGSYAPYGLYNRGFGYSPYFGYPYNYYNTYRPSKLELQIQDIRNDYRDRRWSVRRDKSLSRPQRKEMVRNLKQEEAKAVMEARRSYYKTR